MRKLILHLATFLHSSQFKKNRKIIYFPIVTLLMDKIAYLFKIIMADMLQKICSQQDFLRQKKCGREQITDYKIFFFATRKRGSFV